MEELISSTHRHLHTMRSDQRHSHRRVAPDHHCVLELSLVDLEAPAPIPRGSNSGNSHGSIHSSLSALKSMTDEAPCSRLSSASVISQTATEERRKRLSSMKQQHQEISARNSCHESNTSLDAGTEHSLPSRKSSLRGLFRKTSNRILMLGESTSNKKQLGDSAASFESFCLDMPEKPKSKEPDSSVPTPPKEEPGDPEEAFFPVLSRSFSRDRGTRSCDPPLRRTSSDKPQGRSREYTPSPVRPHNAERNHQSAEGIVEDYAVTRVLRPSLTRTRSDGKPRKPNRRHTPSPMRTRSSGKEEEPRVGDVGSVVGNESKVEQQDRTRHSRRLLLRTRSGEGEQFQSGSDPPFRRTVSDKQSRRSHRNMADRSSSPKRPSSKARHRKPIDDVEDQESRNSSSSTTKTRSGDAGTRRAEMRRSASDKPRRRHATVSSPKRASGNRRRGDSLDADDNGAARQHNQKPRALPSRTLSADAATGVRRSLSDKPCRRSARRHLELPPKRTSSYRVHRKERSLSRNERDKCSSHSRGDDQEDPSEYWEGSSGKGEQSRQSARNRGASPPMRSSRKQRIAARRQEKKECSMAKQEVLPTGPHRRAQLDIQSGGIVEVDASKIKAQEAQNSSFDQAVESNSEEPADGGPRASLGKQLSSRFLLHRTISGSSRKTTSTEAA